MSSVSTRAAAKLSNRAWRRWNSWWVWVPVVSFGLLGWLGFVVAGTRFHERRYWIAAAAFGLCVAVGFALFAIDDDRNTVLADLGTISVLVSMIGGAVVAGIWNRDYLVKVAERQVWGGSAGAPAPAARPPASPTAAPQGFLGVTGTEFYAPAPGAAAPPLAAPPVYRPPAEPVYRPPLSPSAAQSVDINAAPAEQLVAQLAVSPEVAARVVQGRAAVGRYASLDDLVAAAGLQPHELVRFRNRVTFGASQAPPPPPSRPSGRVLDF